MNSVEYIQNISIELLNCYRCARNYSDPRMLPCRHTFCLECLREDVIDKDPCGTMTCPRCLQEFVVPSDGIDGIPKNIFMQRLVDEMKLSPNADWKATLFEDYSVQEVPSCTELVGFDCAQSKLCEVKKDTKLEKTPDWKSRNIINQSKQMLENCVLHPNYSISTFCLNCNVALCSVCRVENHPEHECIPIETVKQQLETLIKSISDCLEENYNTTCQLTKQLQERRQLVTDHFKNLQARVIARADEIKQVVDDHARDLLRNSDSIQEGLQKRMKTEMRNICELVSVMERFKGYVSQLKDNGSVTDISRLFNGMKKTAEKLLIDHRNIKVSLSRCLNADFVSFISPDFDVVSRDYEDVISGMTPHQDEQLVDIVNEEDPFPIDAVESVRSQPNEIFNKIYNAEATIRISDRAVGGLVWFENKIYVIYPGRNAIYIYSDEKQSGQFEQECVIHVEAMQMTPSDIAIVKSTRTLFISQYNLLDVLFRIKLSSRHDLKCECVDGQPDKLSTTSSDQLILLITRDVPRCKYIDIFESTDDGLNRVRSICLSQTVVSNVVESPRGSFVFAYVFGEHNKALICELSRDGTEVLNKFELSPLLNRHDIHLSIGKDGAIFMVDRSRVLVLNGHMTEINSLSGRPYGVYNPHRLCYVHKYNQLVVCHSSRDSFFEALISFFDMTAKHDVEITYRKEVNKGR